MAGRRSEVLWTFQLHMKCALLQQGSQMGTRRSPVELFEVPWLESHP